jgi:hypothetical protein
MIVDREAVVGLFRGVQGAFPHLRMDLRLQHPDVDLSMDIPPQPGVAFLVNLALQGDELHIRAGSFRLEWFPCTSPAIVDQYRDAVTGLLSGQYRILEHCIGEWAVHAQLQRPQAEGWQTIGAWANLGAAVPWPRRRRVLQNVKGENGAA